MGRRYVRRFECEDCGQMTERKWQTGRPMVCIGCATIRHDIATTAAVEAIAAHKRAMRLELMARRAARPSVHPMLGVLGEGV